MRRQIHRLDTCSKLRAWVLETCLRTKATSVVTKQKLVPQWPCRHRNPASMYYARGDLLFRELSGVSKPGRRRSYMGVNGIPLYVRALVGRFVAPPQGCDSGSECTHHNVGGECSAPNLKENKMSRYWVKNRVDCQACFQHPWSGQTIERQRPKGNRPFRD